ncbi:unnamed protein product [Urochloa humidicola]
MRGPVVDERGPGRAGDVVPAHLDQDVPAARLRHLDPPGGHAGAVLTEPRSDWPSQHVVMVDLEISLSYG